MSLVSVTVMDLSDYLLSSVFTPSRPQAAFESNRKHKFEITVTFEGTLHQGPILAVMIGAMALSE